MIVQDELQRLEQADRRFKRAVISVLTALSLLVLLSLVAIVLVLGQNTSVLETHERTLTALKTVAATQAELQRLARLDADARSQLADAHASQVKAEHVEQLKYLNCIVRSTSRRNRLRCLRGLSESPVFHASPRPQPSTKPAPAPAPQPQPSPSPQPAPSPCPTLPTGICRP